MIWMIFAVILIIAMILFLVRSGGVSVLLIFPITLCLIPTIGIFTYPYLKGVRAEVKTLGNEIETIRSAHYSEVIGGELVGGSLDNLKQSTILSDYLTTYAQKKAGYNRTLEQAKVRKEISSICLVG